MTRNHTTAPVADPLERDLRSLLEVDVPADLESRVRSRQGETPGITRRQRRRTAYLLAAAFITLIGMTTAVAVDRMDLFGRSFAVEVEHGTPIGATSEAAGWELTLEHAYADQNKLEFFVFAKPTETDDDLSYVKPEFETVSIVDERGVATRAPAGGGSAPVDEVSPFEFTFRPAEPILGTGTEEYSLVVERLIARWDRSGDLTSETIEGPWTLDFSLASVGGMLFEPETHDDVHGVSITLDRLSVAPSGAKAYLTVEHAPADIDWAPVLIIDKDDYHMESPSYSSVDVGDSGSRSYVVDAHASLVDDGPNPDGLTDPYGQWDIVVHSLSVWDEEADRAQHQLSGPWDLSFEAEAP